MILNKFILLLLLFTNVASANLIIAGVYCLDVVVINNELVVCVRSLEDQKRDLLLLKDNASFVESLYNVLLLRVPDVTGETYYINTLNSKILTKEQLFNIFINSEEYKKLHP